MEAITNPPVWVLLGIILIVIGFIFKIETLFTVIIAGIITGLIAGINFQAILKIIGDSFVANRGVSLFIITLPIMGLLENYGLKQQAITLINKIKGITTGRILVLYMFIRQVAGALSIRISGHPQFVRPLIAPMAQAAADSKYEGITEEDDDKIKAAAAGTENIGNFFGQNLFSGASGVLLVTTTLQAAGYDISELSVSGASIFMALVALVAVVFRSILFDNYLSKKYKEKAGKK